MSAAMQSATVKQDALESGARNSDQTTCPRLPKCSGRRSDFCVASIPFFFWPLPWQGCRHRLRDEDDPSYTAKAKLLIDTRKPQPFQQQRRPPARGLPTPHGATAKSKLSGPRTSHCPY
jgi:hypothetical protein